MKNKPLIIGDKVIQPGERLTIGFPTPEFYTYASVYMPIHIIHGRKPGPCLLVSAAMHGDEMNGIAVIHKLLNTRLLKSIHGTLIAVPVLNVYGLIGLTRNLPDRRDLDGSFPGSESGSFASRLAYNFTKEISSLATHCIDIHSPDHHEYSLPQVLTNFDLPESASMAKAFKAPIMLHSESDRGLLWQNKPPYNIPTIIYEAGEVFCVDDDVVRTGLRGVLRVMRSLNMLRWKGKGGKAIDPILLRSSTWIRSPGSGICQLYKKIGSHVKEGEIIAHIFDPFGTENKYKIAAPFTGIIIAKSTISIVNEGDNIFRMAKTNKEVDSTVEAWSEEYIQE